MRKIDDPDFVSRLVLDASKPPGTPKRKFAYRFRPRRILLRPNALCTSMNSTASLAPLGTLEPRVPAVLVAE